MKTPPRVSVVIPTKNRERALRKCLEALTRQDFRDFEIIIVDGGSKDGTAGLAAEFSKKLPLVFTTQAGGLVRQMNRGCMIASGEIVVRTDDDVEAMPTWVGAIAQTFDMAQDIGGVTGPTIIPDDRKNYRDLFYFQKRLSNGPLLWRLVGKIYFDYFMEGEPLAVSRWFRSGAFSLGSNYSSCLELEGPIEVANQEACNMAVKKELLKKVGGFDESYLGIGEYNEPDVTFKIRKLGYRIMFNPKAALYHLPSIEGFFKERPNSYYRIINFINFYFRHIRLDSPDKAARFFSYVLFLNAFYIYKAVTTKQFDQFGSIPGTVVGLAKNLLWKGIKA
jgi:glycosyltransferase involved in cell wall biosynthesis